MPSQLPLPTLRELRRAFKSGVVERFKVADTHDGAIYDVLGGVGALVFQRLASRDRETFRSIYFDHSKGDEFVKLATARFPDIDPPVQAAAGTGIGYFSRPTDVNGGGTLLKGSRIAVIAHHGGQSHTYEVAEDTPVDATALAVQVPIVASALGSGVATDTLTSAPLKIRLVDPFWDSTWTVDRVVCGDGVSREEDKDARARIRKTREDGRVGYPKAIEAACRAAGASEVALFASDFLSTNPDTLVESIGELDEDGYGDVGLNRIYVGDASFTTPDSLRRACLIAVDGVAICGIAPQVLGMQPTLVTLDVTVTLWKDPGRAADLFASSSLAAVLNYFVTRKNPFYFRFPAIRGAIIRATPDVQTIDFDSDIDEPALTEIFDANPINRYYVTPSSVTVTVQGPET